uniref:C2H2-type domain-containing protein n=1 Tax=Oryzias latipes TaxID=8090 RepID=A0A3P9JZU7_ORYLA
MAGKKAAKYRKTTSLLSRSRHISTTTVKRRLCESGLHGRISARKPLLKKGNKQKRLVWTKQHKEWTLDQWKSYLKNLKNHCQRWHNMSVVTRGGHLSCADCGKSFKATWGQGPHLCHEPDAAKSEDKPICLDTGVQCRVCGKKVRTPQSLVDHMRTHTGDRPFACKDCGRKFVERSSWRQHMKIHTGEKPFKCEVCGKAFVRSHHLRCHLTTHSGKKEYSCPECGKEFGFKSSLDLHRTHTGERPYKCDECDKSFTQSGDLVKHKRIHSGEKPFECPECHRCYTSSGDLGKHRRSHTNLRPYTCKECGKSFPVRIDGIPSLLPTHVPTPFWGTI